MKPSEFFSYFKERPKRTLGATAMLLASLYAGVKGCPESQSPTPTQEANDSAEVDGFRKTLEIIARVILSSEQEEDPAPPAEEEHFYQIDPEDPDLYLNTAVECLTEFNEFICPRDHSLFGDTAYYCLPTGESEEFHVPFILSHVTGYPYWCYGIDQDDSEAVENSGCTSYRAAKIGMRPGPEISFDPKHFERNDFCDKVLEKAKDLNNEENCKWVYSEDVLNGTNYGRECDNRWNRNLDFAFDSDAAKDMQDSIRKKLKDANIDFDVLETGEIVLDQETSVSVVAVGPETAKSMSVFPNGEFVIYNNPSEHFYFQVNKSGNRFGTYDENKFIGFLGTDTTSQEDTGN